MFLRRRTPKQEKSPALIPVINEKTNFSHLPSEMQTLIIQFLDLKNAARFAAVNHHCHELIYFNYNYSHRPFKELTEKCHTYSKIYFSLQKSRDYWSKENNQSRIEQGTHPLKSTLRNAEDFRLFFYHLMGIATCLTITPSESFNKACLLISFPLCAIFTSVSVMQSLENSYPSQRVIKEKLRHIQKDTSAIYSQVNEELGEEIAIQLPRITATLATVGAFSPPARDTLTTDELETLCVFAP